MKTKDKVKKSRSQVSGARSQDSEVRSMPGGPVQNVSCRGGRLTADS